MDKTITRFRYHACSDCGYSITESWAGPHELPAEEMVCRYCNKPMPDLTNTEKGARAIIEEAKRTRKEAKNSRDDVT
jgi:hypothetical protein